MENFIDKETLKYGFCSYYAHAYTQQFPDNKIIAIMEHDVELNEDYLVHVVLEDNNGTYFDSKGQYERISHSIMNIADIDFMAIYTKTLTPDQLIVQIFKDFHTFDENIYELTLNHIKENI